MRKASVAQGNLGIVYKGGCQYLRTDRTKIIQAFRQRYRWSLSVLDLGIHYKHRCGSVQIEIDIFFASAKEQTGTQEQDQILHSLKLKDAFIFQQDRSDY